MKSNFGKTQRNRMLAVFLSVIMVFSLGTGLTFAGNEETPLDNGGISAQALGDSAQWISSTSGEGRITMTESPQTVTVTFKLTNVASVQEAEDVVSAGAFYLYRDKGSMPTDIYPYQFLGRGPTTARGRAPEAVDGTPWTLQDWKVANTNGTLNSTPLFSGYTTNISLAGSVATVSYSFNVARFFGQAAANNFRTAFLDYTGDYRFEFRDSSNIVKGNTTVHLAPYDSYRTMPEIEKEINQAAAYINDPGNDRDMYAEVRSLGTSEYGRNMPYIIIAKSKKAIADYEALMEQEENDPTALLAKLNTGYTDFQVPILYSNIHANEFNGVDSILNFMWDLAKKTRIDYQTMASFKPEGTAQLVAERASAGAIYPAVFDTLADKEKPTSLGYIRGTSTISTALNASSISVNMSKYYNMQPTAFEVEKILDDVFFILVPEQNVDGRTLSAREGYGGVDLNRDNLFQTQKETQNMTKMIAAWNPVIFWEQHGFVADFQIEPCTPPHEANFEYDLLAKTLIGAGEAYANGAVSNNSTYNSYRMPLRDYFDGSWDVWDDVSTAYTPEYAMLHGTVAYTVEVPAANEDGNTALEYGLINNAKFTAENKVEFLKNQVTGYERGVKNIDADSIDPWYEDIDGNVGAESNIFRPKYAENNNYFPEYYVIPNDSASQRNLKAVQEMTQWLMDSDVKVTTLTTDAAVKDADGVERDLPAGSVVVDMHQAKRNVANVALSNGLKLKNWGTTLYSEPVTAFPEMRGFDCYVITKQDALDGKLAPLTTATAVKSETVNAPGTIIFNGSVETTRAINALLDAGKDVGFIQSGAYKGHFIVTTEDYNTIKDGYSISVRPTSILQPAKRIETGKVFLLGEPTTKFEGTAPNLYGASEKPRIASGYYDFNYNNRALAKEMGFDVTTTLSGAAVIAGHNTLSDAQIDAVKGGTPYVGWGTNAVTNAKTLFNASNLNVGTIVSTNGTGNADALYETEYVADSMVTAAKRYYNDEITYNYGCSYITSVPSGVDVLAKVKGTDILAGSMPASRYAGFLGSIQGFQYKSNGADIVVYTHPLARKNHQKDDYMLISSAIFDAMTTSQDFDPGNGLDPPASSSMLDTLQFIVNWYETNFPEDDYTPASWKPFAEALDAAKAILAAPGDYSDNDILDAMDVIVAGELGLVFRTDKSGLKSAIDYAENMLKPENIGKYLPASVANLQIAFTSASAVYADGDATQAEVEQARTDLVLAIGKMYELGDKTGLRALYTLVSRYTAGSYTPASWKTFTDALTAAKTVLDNPDALKDPVEAAYTALANATAGLIRKADLAGLNAAIAIAQEIVDHIGDYIPSTVVGLADLLSSTKLIAGDLNVSQGAIDAAAAALNAKILGARLKPDLSGLLSATNRAKALDAANYTVDSYKPLSTAIAGAEAVLAKPDEVTQDDVRNATHAVNSGIAGLVLKTGVTVSGENGTTTAPAAKTVIPKTKVLKITASAKAKVVVKWAKAPSTAKVTGYQIQYRVKGTSKWTTKTVSAKSASLTLKGLKKNKQYQFRIRAYRTNSAAKEYGAWSTVKVSKRVK